jgi:excisionase family DNA binding protein
MQMEWATVPELAAEYRYHPATITRLLASGQVPGFKPAGHRWRVRREDWNRYLASRCSMPATNSRDDSAA